ncbi:MAG: peroxiredoxin [Patescibacteria group bacterium]|jgi:alkyl hydroperoxide reductase subunit AhpC
MLILGKPAPDFKAVPAYQTGEFRSVSLSEYRGHWLVLFFYPRDFTFVCPTELRGFAAHEHEFEKLGAKIVAASTDSQWSHKAWFERDLPEVKYPVLADTALKLADAYGVLNADDGSAERGLFIIDPEGIVRYIVVSASAVGRSVTETLRVLQALKSGGLCPLDWKDGEKTLGKAK